MKTTSIRLPPAMHEGVSAADEPLAEIVRPALQSYLVNRMVGRCVVTGDVLYTHSGFMSVTRGTPLADGLGINEVERFVISGDVASEVSEYISTGRADEIDTSPEYYERVGPVIYAAEEEYLSNAHDDHNAWNRWAECLLEPTLDSNDWYCRASNLLIRCGISGTDREHVSLQRIWDNTPVDTREQLIDEYMHERDVDGVDNLKTALDQIDLHTDT